ncbi:ribulose-phosphate 3-epimerase [Mycoplasmopsis sturni]|uniref:ribulose-phosphate 3-epimerase n=1 Tax=Mycoplasmopsis sturni TaxID=39047 RepID=UPI000562CE52|nr:ribulose-phosphate 3-epimerase [Mycoplasmopsis sturni]
MKKFKNRFVTPSLLNIESEKRLEVANTLVNNGIKWIHYDIMDGQFVPNTAITPEEIIEIDTKGLPHFKDAHLMVNDPVPYIEQLRDNVDIFTVHFEALDDNAQEEFLDFLQKTEFNIGMAIKPTTKVSEIKKFLPYLKLVLVMSVEPGKGGQKFIPESIDKIKQLSEYRFTKGFPYLIQVDGGINDKTGPECFKAGADACVAGTFLVFEPTKEKINSIFGIKPKKSKQ